MLSRWSMTFLFLVSLFSGYSLADGEVYDGWRYGWYDSAQGHPGTRYEAPMRSAVYAPSTFQQYPFYGLTPNGTLVYTGPGWQPGSSYYRPNGVSVSRPYQMGAGGARPMRRHGRW